MLVCGGTHVGRRRRAGHDETGGDRHEQSGDLRHKTVTDGEHREPVNRLRRAHPHLHHAHAKPAEQVDEGDDDAGDGVALDELRTTVHRTVEIGLGRDVGAALARSVLIDEPRVEIGINCHLLAGHCVQCEARAHLCHAACTVRDDRKLDDNEDEEDDQTDDEGATHHEVTEGVDHLTGVAVSKDKAR